MSLRHRKDALPLHRQERKIPLVLIGIVTLLLIVAVFFLGTKRHAIAAALQSGSTYQAEFSRQDLLLPSQTKVKVAGVPVGVVTGLKHNAQGALVSMKIFGSDGKKLGTAPTAALRIGTLLGGINYVQITPGGAPGSPQGIIPLSRTTSPVYIDSVLSSMPPLAQDGAKQFIKQFQQTFAQGGEQSTQDFLANAPAALTPSAGVLNAFQGQTPSTLTDLVASVERTDATVIARQGQIESVVSGLGTFSATLGNQSGALQQTASTLGLDLANARSGLAALDTTLHELDATAGIARPSVQHLGVFLAQSQPTLVTAAPVLAQLDPFLSNTIPLLSQLVPTSTQTTTFLDQINGPVLDRLLNPTASGQAIIPTLNKVQNVADERGLDGKPATLYQEIAYAATGLDGVASYYDHAGHYTPVILGYSAYSLIGPDQSLPNAATDVCGGMVCPGGTSPGGSNGNVLVGGNRAQTAPKVVTPPGVTP